MSYIRYSKIQKEEILHLLGKIYDIMIIISKHYGENEDYIQCSKWITNYTYKREKIGIKLLTNFIQGLEIKYGSIL